MNPTTPRKQSIPSKTQEPTRYKQTCVFLIDLAACKSLAELDTTVDLWETCLTRILLLLQNHSEFCWDFVFFHSKTPFVAKNPHLTSKLSLGEFAKLARQTWKDAENMQETSATIFPANSIKQALSYYLTNTPWTKPRDLEEEFKTPNLIKRNKVLKKSLVQHIVQKSLNTLSTLPKATVLNHLILLSPLPTLEDYFDSNLPIVGNHAAELVYQMIMGRDGSQWAHCMDNRCQVSWIDTSSTLSQPKILYDSKDLLTKCIANSLTCMGGSLIPGSVLLLSSTFPLDWNLDLDDLDNPVPCFSSFPDLGKRVVLNGPSFLRDKIFVEECSTIKVNGGDVKWLQLKKGDSEGLSSTRLPQNLSKMSTIHVSLLKPEYYNSSKEPIWISQDLSTISQDLFKSDHVGIFFCENITLLLFPLSPPLQQLAVIRVLRPKALSKIQTRLQQPPPALPRLPFQTKTIKQIRDEDARLLKKTAKELAKNPVVKPKQKLALAMIPNLPSTPHMSTLALDSDVPMEVEQAWIPPTMPHNVQDWNDGWNWLQELLRQWFDEWNPLHKGPATLLANVLLEINQLENPTLLFSHLQSQLKPLDEFLQECKDVEWTLMIAQGQVQVLWHLLAIALSQLLQLPLPTLNIPSPPRKTILRRRKPPQDAWKERLLSYCKRLSTTFAIQSSQNFDSTIPGEAQMIAFYQILKDERWEKFSIQPLATEVSFYFQVEDESPQEEPVVSDDDFDWIAMLEPPSPTPSSSSITSSQSQPMVRRGIPARSDSQSSVTQPRSDSSNGSQNRMASMVPRGMFATGNVYKFVSMPKKVKPEKRVRRKPAASLDQRRTELQRRDLLLPGQEWGKGLRTFGQLTLKPTEISTPPGLKKMPKKLLSPEADEPETPTKKRPGEREEGFWGKRLRT